MDGLRKAHSKTRLGCGRCKQRKVRCDLRPPICSNCERRGEACDYSLAYAGDAVQSRRLYVSPHHTLQELPDNISSFSFELALHFDALTSNTFDLPETPVIWRKDLIRRSDVQPYLRKSSLALAALHITHLRPMQSDASSLYHIAHAYQNEAYALFRRQVHLINHDTGPDILGFCVMAAIFQFSASLVEGKVSDGKEAMDIISPLLALRSGALLLASCHDVTIRHESLGGALGRLGPEIETPPFSIPQQNQKALEELERAKLCVETTAYSTPASSHAFLVLRQVLTLFPSTPKGWLHVIFWPAMVRDDYFDELRAKQPGAIVVFVYWCAYLNNSLRQWYLEKWPRAAASHEMIRLEPMWHDILAWPRHQLGILGPNHDRTGLEID